MLLALVPAHNESAGIVDAINGLRRQTTPPDRIVVVADNCTDDTADLARAADAEVLETVGNRNKKAGALNQALREYLPVIPDDALILIQDADSILDSRFIANATKHLDNPEVGAVGGVFDGSEGGGFVGHLQRNEYARYARDVARLKGRCLVVTGTAAIFRASTMREISAARMTGKIPAGDGNGGIYDTTVLTEDNEISFALLHLGYKILSPANCKLVTEVMPTWRDLWRQRLRWKRGAMENCIQYGLTRYTWKYWGRQLFTLLGVLVTFLYLASLGWSVAVYGGINIAPFWMAVTGIFVIERVVTVQYRGIRQMIVSSTMYELVFDMFLQFVHAKAYADVMFNRKREW
jgi:biofilm PGA synthesis N-glycosyltransferase PgaC